MNSGFLRAARCWWCNVDLFDGINGFSWCRFARRCRFGGMMIIIVWFIAGACSDIHYWMTVLIVNCLMWRRTAIDICAVQVIVGFMSFDWISTNAAQDITFTRGLFRPREFQQSIQYCAFCSTDQFNSFNQQSIYQK